MLHKTYSLFLYAQTILDRRGKQKNRPTIVIIAEVDADILSNDQFENINKKIIIIFIIDLTVKNNKYIFLKSNLKY